MESAKLYSYFRSSASHRVRIALNFKEVPYETVPVHLIKNGGEHKLPEFMKMNPMGQVPVLEFQENGKTFYLTQSIAIMEFLEERVPKNPLLPNDSIERALVRRWVEVINSGIQPHQNLPLLARLKGLKEGEEIVHAREFNMKGLSALETYAATCSGTFSFGEQVGLADVCLIPQLVSARRFGIHVEQFFPKLAGIEHACLKLEAFKKAAPEAQPDHAP